LTFKTPDLALVDATVRAAKVTNAKSGVLNVNWVDDMVCPDSDHLDNLVEVVLDTDGTSDLSYDNYRQKCAEAFFGFDAEEVV
jgi:hypothetical protein